MVPDPIAALRRMQNPCRLCPRECRVMRAEGERGFCGTTSRPVMASWGPHYGEEPVLVGARGSGTIFLAGCGLKCVFCQNFDISHSVAGRECSGAEVASVMLELARRGVENINFVTPTHHAPQVAEAVMLARREGLGLPVVYNCGGYESVEVLKLLDGLVDIYMPDAKFMDHQASASYLGAQDYPERMQAALGEMQRQVGDLATEDGIATRGLLIRHLVMPGYSEDSRRIVDFICDELSPRAFVNIMGQYRPLCSAGDYPAIDRRPDPLEVEEVRNYARSRNLRLSD